MQRVAELRDEEGYTASDFRFVSFSRSHAADLENDVLDAWRDRLERLDDDQARQVEETLIDSVSTLHSLCSRLTNTPRIITPESDAEFYQDFWRRRGFEFDASESPSAYLDPDEMDSSERGRVEQLLAADQLLAALGAGLDGEGLGLVPASLGHIPVEIDLHAARVVELIREWRTHKLENGVKEHHDYILDAANSEKTPDCRVLVVDEMQDYSPLEYAVVRDWIRSGDLDHVILAGDEFQSIYGFKLADSTYFTGLEVNDEDVLTESYRCPRAVCRVARSVCPPTRITSARSDEGRVLDASTQTPEDLASLVQQLLADHPVDAYEADPTSVFLLTRTNRQAAKVGWALRRTGIPYTSTVDGEESPWTEDVLNAIETLRLAASGGCAVSTDAADPLIDMATNSKDRREMAEAPSFGSLDVDSVSAVDIWTAFPDCDSATDIIRTLDVDDYIAEMIQGALHSDADLTPGLVEVGTIHSVKGREAPAVVVLDGYPHRLSERYQADNEFAEEEDRLAYVAATRARATLVVAREFLGGSSFPPFEPPLERVAESSPAGGVIHQ
ncbi:ATP-dependent DNA helicase UvrD [Natrarchaeobaculum sulfurireducens]|uniref:DNA 3'-5' helicase n=2 Tax=Natrarchaeobaculum sulfurireducens TaxID=2044521 RepID=A0A346PQK0_9EURY|nr:ATP-dependent DNA helicase UvrD [Natrarchaeobaculum sulfurireducens]